MKRSILNFPFVRRFRRCVLLLGLVAVSAPAAPLPVPFRAVATTAMVRDIVQQVAADRGQVSGLMGEGVDPHLYKPTRDDVQKLLRADVVFYSGLMLEGRMTDTFERIAKRGVPVFAVNFGVQAA